ncbi:MAG: glycosyltransferase family A protein [Polyangiaceae bacterium]|jgi:glycosyltransferase involved in cell wall biosynthesis
MLAPEVSIVLPAFNRLNYLRQAIDSVLSQTHEDWELIIADDGSDAEARTYLRNLSDARIVVLWLPHCGNPGAVRNQAIRRSRGQLIAFLDSDDVWAPRKLAVQLEIMRSRPDRRWSYTNVVLTDEHGHPLPNTDTGRWGLYDGQIVEPLLNFTVNIATATVMVERRFIDEVGGFDEEQRYGEDCDLWLRLALRSDVSVTPEPLACIRDRHVDRYSLDRIAEYRSWVRLFGKMAKLLPDPRLRSLCHKRRGDAALFLAGLYFDQGDHVAAARTVIGASRFSWPYPRWWWGASKAIVRPMVPLRWLSKYRDRVMARSSAPDP